MSLHEGQFLKDGYVCLFGDDFKKLNRLDEIFRSFIDGKEQEEFHIPALIDGDVLEKCGYFSTFPHQLIVAGSIRNTDYSEIVSEKRVKEKNLQVLNKYLTPSACLHLYPMIEKRSVSRNEVITAKARVYRYEDQGTLSLTRLMDFTVREIVVVGSEDYVQTILKELEMKALRFAQGITPDAEMIVATDPFYPSRENKVRSKIQKANTMKKELLLPVKNKRVAAASFNFHGTHFSKVFNFDKANQVVTGCVGFGLERWLAAFSGKEW